MVNQVVVVVDSINDFINLLNDNKEEVEFNIVVESNNKETRLISSGNLGYIGIDKDRDEYICIIFGANDLFIKICDIYEIKINDGYYSILTKNNYFKRIDFRIKNSLNVYEFNLNN